MIGYTLRTCLEPLELLKFTTGTEGAAAIFEELLKSSSARSKDLTEWRETGQVLTASR
jgi:hypothetical protein